MSLWFVIDLPCVSDGILSNDDIKFEVIENIISSYIIDVHFCIDCDKKSN